MPIIIRFALFAGLQTIDRVSKEAEQLRRQIETLESSHRRDMAELTDDCDARISQMEKEVFIHPVYIDSPFSWLLSFHTLPISASYVMSWYCYFLISMSYLFRSY